jgi:uncharacterized protein
VTDNSSDEPRALAASDSVAHAPSALPSEPITPGERIEIVDVLRGFAILGILVVNMYWFANPLILVFTEMEPPKGAVDRVVMWGITFFCEGKFYTLFSLLFGFGMYVQMTRARARGAPFAARFARRLCVLLGIGLAHVVLLWPGDILIAYALVGFGLLLFRNCSPRALLAWAALALFSLTVFFAALTPVVQRIEAVETAASQPTSSEAAGDAQFTEMMSRWAQEAYDVYGQGHFGQIVLRHLFDYVLIFFGAVIFSFPVFLGLFLLGVYIGKRRVLEDLPGRRGFFRRGLFWGFALGAPASAYGVVAGELLSVNELTWPVVAWIFASTVGSLGMACAYASGLALLFQRDAGRRFLTPLASVGRMALTNYLLQSLICTTICNSYGLALYGKISPAAGLPLTFAIFAVQIVLSNWWLRRYRFGPVEWLWRSLTYGRRQPMRIPPPANG